MATTKRRWLQFSLRTALALVTLLCVVLSLWIVPAERQRRTVAAIEGSGGNVLSQQATTETSFITCLRRWLPHDYFDEVYFVDLSDTQVTDSGLVHLHRLTGLKWLFLDNTQVTDTGLAHLQGLTSLQGLSLNATQVTDAGLVHLQGLNLQDFAISDTQVTDAGLVHLQGLTSLTRLYLGDTQVTDAGLVHLKRLTNLQRLHLRRAQVTNSGVAQLREALPKCKINGL